MRQSTPAAVRPGVSAVEGAGAFGPLDRYGTIRSKAADQASRRIHTFNSRGGGKCRL